MSDVVFTSSYGLVLGLGVQKNPSSNAALGKIREYDGTVLTLSYMENVTSIISQEKYSMPLMKKIQEILFIKLKLFFLEILITDFGRN